MRLHPKCNAWAILVATIAMVIPVSGDAGPKLPNDINLGRMEGSYNLDNKGYRISLRVIDWTYALGDAKSRTAAISVDVVENAENSCVGSVAGFADAINNQTLILDHGKGQDRCLLKIQFGNQPTRSMEAGYGTARITEQICTSHGAVCSFSGILRRSQD